MGRGFRGFAVAALAAGALAAGNASAADICISQQAKDALSQCPGGKMEASAGKKPAVSFNSAPQAVNLKKRDDQTKPSVPQTSQQIAQRDERRNRLEARSRQLLVTEIQGLESLYSSTPKDAADRPSLMRRLAEGYVELESAATRDKTELGIKIDEAKRKTPGSVSKLQEEVGKADKLITGARTAAIKYYGLLETQYPKWCQSVNKADPSKSSGCTDEVLYYLAYEHEQANDLEKARKVYLKLIQNWPQSKFIANAYLAFGELFFNEAQGDPSKWALAEQSYNEVIKYPPPDNKVFGYAHYKLAYVAWNKGDFQKAISEFKKTIDFGQQYSSLPNAKELANSARRDLVPVYALAGEPKKAHDFFKPLSGDTGGQTEKTFKMMDDLGQNYLDTGHYQQGIELYSDLITRDRGPKYCVYQSHIAEATLAMKSGNKDQIMTELGKQQDVYTKFEKENQPADAKLKCANVTAELLSETAMAWHLEAVGSGGVRGTGDKKTMSLASQLYEKVIAGFNKEQFAKFEFPRILKEDWPSIAKIKYAMADLTYFNKDWAKCGPAFDAVVADDPTGPQAPEAAYAAVLCYQNIYTETHKGDAARKGTGNLPGGDDKKKGGKGAPASKAKELAPKEFTENQKGMITAFNRYICYIKPPANDKEAQEQYVEVKYARARTYFEAQHWEEAALGFRDVAINHADKDAAIYASQLYLESLNILGSSLEPAHPSCYDDMAADVPKFIESFCQKGKEKDAEQCGTLIRIQRDIERLRAEKLVEAAGKGGADAPRQFEKAANQYMDMWRKYSEDACKNKQPACERAEEILYNAAKAFQAARLIAKAISARKYLIDPQYNLNNTELAKKAVYEIGGNYQAIAVYEEAANWYERFARESPKMDKAPEALQDAVVLRLGLGQEDQAIKDADLFNKNYGSQKPAQTAQIAFAIGSHYAEKEDWDNARKRLSASMGQIDRNAGLDIQIQAHALMGRVYTKINNASQAQSEYSKVRGLWSNPDAQLKKLDAAYPDENDRIRRLGKTLTAVGEALFFFAEVKKKEVDKVKFPEYKGSGDKADVLKHVNTKVADWVKKKRTAIEDADKEYQKVRNLQPVPPPRWVIAAGSRVGQMWGKFVAEFRAAPIPAEWKKNGPHPLIPDLNWEDIRGNYYAALDEASEPQKQQAKGAFKECLDLSVRFQYFDEFSRACEVWLSKNYGAEYHLIDEFRGSPNRVAAGLTDKPLAVNIDGSFFKADTPAPEAEKDDSASKGDSKADAKSDAKGGATTSGDSKGSKEKSALDRATTKPKK
jgi:TolA-binding protein